MQQQTSERSVFVHLLINKDMLNDACCEEVLQTDLKRIEILEKAIQGFLLSRVASLKESIRARHRAENKSLVKKFFAENLENKGSKSSTKRKGECAAGTIYIHKEGSVGEMRAETSLKDFSIEVMPSDDKVLIDLTRASSLAMLDLSSKPEDYEWANCVPQKITIRHQSSGKVYSSPQSSVFIPRRATHKTANPLSEADDDLAASSLQWWGRPIWAWTRHEKMLAHGVIMALDLTKDLHSHLHSVFAGSLIQLVVSNTRCIGNLTSASMRGRQNCLLVIDYLDVAKINLTRPTPREIVEAKVVSPEPRSASGATNDEIGHEQKIIEKAGSAPRKETLSPKKADTEWNDDDNADLTSSITIVATTATTAAAGGTDQIEKENWFMHCGETQTQTPIALVSSSQDSMSEAEESPPESIDKAAEIVLEKGYSDESDTPDCAIVTLTESTATDDYSQVYEYFLPQPAQIDSRGVDLTVLSQLPPKVRSEVRLAAAVHDKRVKRKRPNINSKLVQWLATTDTATKRVSSLASTAHIPAKKRKNSISAFFSEKSNS
jgi:hypothetical protein